LKTEQDVLPSDSRTAYTYHIHGYNVYVSYISRICLCFAVKKGCNANVFVICAIKNYLLTYY